MDKVALKSRDWLSIRQGSNNDTQIACFLIDGEAVCLPARFDASIRPCNANGDNHLEILASDSESQSFAGRLHLAAAMGKQITFIYAQLDEDELSMIDNLIEAEESDWFEQMANTKRWIVYPFQCDCLDNRDRKAAFLFNLSSV